VTSDQSQTETANIVCISNSYYCGRTLCVRHCLHISVSIVV